MDLLFKLIISPLDENTASLVNVNRGQMLASSSNNSIFIHTGKYEGRNDYFTPEDVRIYNGIDETGKEYKITKIETHAFSHCSDMINLVIGPYVNEIKWNMYQCKSLLNIFVAEENTIFHDTEGVLFKGNELIGFPQGRTGHYDVPVGTRKIGNMAFKSCKISSITFPETLEEIGDNAFYECPNISEFILPKSIKKIHKNCNVANEPITQVFYLYDDINKTNPLKITDLIKMFPV